MRLFGILPIRLASALFALACLATGSPATAQDGETGAQGRAFERLADGSIGPEIGGVRLQFIAEDGTLEGSATTSDGGAYRVALAPGYYETTAKHEGYETRSSGINVQENSGYNTLNFFLVALEGAGDEPEAPAPERDPPPQPSTEAGASEGGSVGGSVRAGTGSGKFHLDFSAEAEPLGGEIRYAPSTGDAVRGVVNVCYRQSGSRVAIGGELKGDGPTRWFEIVLEDHGQGRNAPQADRAGFRTMSQRPDCDLGTAAPHAVTSGNVDLQGSGG